MPELPEVETVVRNLAPAIEGKQIKKVVLPAHYKRALSGISLRKLNQSIAQKTVRKVSRRAKYIILHLDKDCIAIHLRMTGHLKLNKDEGDDAYITCTLFFDDGTQLFFKDVRKFGRWEYLENYIALDKRLGVEPLSKYFNTDYLYAHMQRRKKMMKHFLLDQTIVAGLGNIYVDEALWRAKIHPCSLCCDVQRKNAAQLLKAIKLVLTQSIEMNGTTFSSFYYGEQKQGNFKSLLKVYGRKDKPCHRCKTPIVKLKVQQRGTHICPKCQEQ